MLKFVEKIPPETVIDETAVRIYLPISDRVRSRVKITLDDGQDAGLFLPRGDLLRGGDYVKSECGVIAKIVAAPEHVSTVHCDDPWMLAKAAYHLGNRHVPLQVEAGWLRYLHDHVLDEMIQQLGLQVTLSNDAFEPEAGAYKQQPHSHGHSHSH